MNLVESVNKIISDLKKFSKFVKLSTSKEIYDFLCKHGNYDESYEEFCKEILNVQNLGDEKMKYVTGGFSKKNLAKAGAGIVALCNIIPSYTSAGVLLENKAASQLMENGSEFIGNKIGETVLDKLGLGKLSGAVPLAISLIKYAINKADDNTKQNSSTNQNVSVGGKLTNNSSEISKLNSSSNQTTQEESYGKYTSTFGEPGKDPNYEIPTGNMTLNDALERLYDLVMVGLHKNTAESFREYLDNSVDKIQNLTYAVLNYIGRNQQRYQEVNNWHVHKLAHYRLQQNEDRANHPLWKEYRNTQVQLENIREEYRNENYEFDKKENSNIPQEVRDEYERLQSRINELDNEIHKLPSFRKFPIVQAIPYASWINFDWLVGNVTRLVGQDLFDKNHNYTIFTYGTIPIVQTITSANCVFNYSHPFFKEMESVWHGQHNNTNN